MRVMSTEKTPTNAPEFTVSELAFSIKSTVEETFGRVRVRGELSRISIPKSGHMYSSLKDEKSVIDAVCWKGTLSRLSIKPEEGLEVICTGKMTTYPGSSKYQLIIESLELAGEGALLKMLEERRKKLTAEGLFDPERKKPLPFLPERIGVVTSPTGAVIRDILHRLDDRFPRHVLIWPVKVQGAGAAEEITAAIKGFDALPETHRPDVLIVARGGGSLEDLMPFNEENVVRAAANCSIPLISAVGHETDTTLIDYAADARAPTPTGAAEIAVPVRLNLMAQIADDGQRLITSITRLIRENKQRMATNAAKLGSPERLLELKIQQIDRKSDQLDNTLQNLITKKRQTFIESGTRLPHPRQTIAAKEQKLSHTSAQCDTAFRGQMIACANKLSMQSAALRPPAHRIKNAARDINQIGEYLDKALKQLLKENRTKIERCAEKLELLSFENILDRGFVVVRDDKDTPITDISRLNNGDHIALQFKQNKKIAATIDNTNNAHAGKKIIADQKTGQEKSNTPQETQTKKPPQKQGSLF